MVAYTMMRRIWEDAEYGRERYRIIWKWVLIKDS